MAHGGCLGGTELGLNWFADFIIRAVLQHSPPASHAG
jgi:hypothetical protein